MDRKKVFVCAVFAALVASFALAASARDEDTTEQVDWSEAANYAELMDTFVNSNNVEMATYYDEGQNVLWSQPASMSVEDATAELAKDPEGAMLDSISQWILPTALWLCLDDAGTSCYKWSSGDISFVSVTGNVAKYIASNDNCGVEGIERIWASATSGNVDYCDEPDYIYYRGYYRNEADTNWIVAMDDYSCLTWLGATRYYIDEPDMTGLDYDFGSDRRAVRFRFYSGGDPYYSDLWVRSCNQ
jgi:hypothetical protein